jgi:hypothetical protein
MYSEPLTLDISAGDILIAKRIVIIIIIIIIIDIFQRV